VTIPLFGKPPQYVRDRSRAITDQRS